MKGFMHIVEILLVIVLLFIVFTQFATIPSISGDAPKTKLNLISKDILKAFEKKGVDWFNRTELENEFNQTLPGNIIYSVLLKNVIKPEIIVECLCNDQEMQIIQDILDPNDFMLNDVNISFIVIQVTDIDELFSLDSDVVLIYGYEDFSQNPYYLRNFLNYDKGVIEIFDVNLSTIDSVQRDTFGLDSNENSYQDRDIEFSDSSLDNGRELNKIYDYFNYIPIFYDSFKNLEKWLERYGNADISQSMGRPEPSASLTAETLIETKTYRAFETGEIDFDVYLQNGAVLLIGFGEHLASISNNQSFGYDSFLSRSMNSVGQNTSHLTASGTWNHIKIVVRRGELKLYSNGENVATSIPLSISPTNISVSNKFGDVYVDNVKTTYLEENVFRNFLEPQENISKQVTNNRNKILIEQRVTGLPACIINQNIEGIGKGRTVWLSNNSNYDPDYKNLVKSLIAWAAGDEYRVIKSDMKIPVSSHIYKTLKKDMLQNVKVILELGYLY